MALLEAIGSTMRYIYAWVRGLINVLVFENGYLHPLLSLFVIGIAISAVFLGIKIIRKITWGT